ncbi:GNAT family N-acetyltransferase [Brachybacterium alimentarium]|uniref:GNAT family N-acetyltransferase n=1 Tax=Brachybacterium alimentarium TaxID=47845 RepID=UPI003FD39F64
MTPWTTRPELPRDAPALHALIAEAFPTAEEADLVDALRADASAWIEGLSTVATDENGRLVAHALLTRATVGGEPVLALAPCATLPDVQGRGAGSAVIRAGLEAARGQGENAVVVLGHPDFYPRFGFEPASLAGITSPFDAPDDAFLAVALGSARPVPRGEISYPEAFGI